MNRRFLRILSVGAVALTVMLLVWQTDFLGSHRADAGRYRTAPNLFYNDYVPPTGCPGVGAQLYVSPRPTPPMVGHTWVTYEALMPHEFLWHHCREYTRIHPDGRRTHVKVFWE